MNRIFMRMPGPMTGRVGSRSSRVYDPSVAEPYDVLFSMPWAGPLLAGTGAAGGAETQILMLARGLAAGGLRVGIVAIGERTSLPREVDGVEVLAQPRPPGIRFLGGFLHDLNTLRALIRRRASVVVTRIAGRNVAVAALAARLRGARFVYSSANITDFRYEGFDHPVNVRLFHIGLHAASEVVVQTQEQAELCRARLGRAPALIRSITERASPRVADPEAFLWIGRLVPYKRLDVYLDLAADVPEARFRVIAVPGLGQEPELQARLERARDELPNLELLDPRPRAELGSLIDRAVAMVNTGEREGMPNVFLEGWARGVPALAYGHDPDGVVQRHGLGGYAAGSRERLAELARTLWESRHDQREVAESCIAYVRREHDLDGVCAAWRDVLLQGKTG
jgi:glycosyltransferase involved in cell wall biosynthesis